MSSGPSLGVAYLTLLPTMKGSAAVIERELGSVPAAAVGGKLGRQLSAGLKGTATAAMAAVGAAGAAAFVKGFGRLRAIDDAQAKLRGLGNDAKTIEIVMKNAGASVKGTAFGLDAAATAAAGAMAAGIKPGKALERNLKLVADAATIAGVGMGEMGAIFNKAAASNKVQMDVINQLHDAGVPALSFLAKTMGVTAEEASKMASKGQIDFATFQNAMEAGLGGAALSSGNTFTGAMANVFAALGRIGAGIMGGVFPQIAPLFQRIQAALGPIEERAAALGTVIGEKVAPVFEKTVDLLGAGANKFDSLKTVLGPATAAFAALGASGLAPLLGMVPGLGGLAGVLTSLGGPIGIVSAAFLGMVATSPELQSALGALLGALGGLAQQVAPSLQQIASLLMGALAVGLGFLADGLTVVLGWLTAVVSALAPYSDLLMSLAIGIGVVVVAVKTWTVAGNLLRGAMAVWKAAQLGWTAASYGAVGASYAATAATKGQMVATKLAAGAQRILNVVMRANPLGLIVTAITAVVGALTWFFTQTETGKAIWAEFSRFLQEAWANISLAFRIAWETVLKPVFDAIVAVATWVFENILRPAFEVAQVGFSFMAGIFQGIWETILKPVFDGIGAVFQWVYTNIIVPVIVGIQLYVKAWAAIFTWLWTTILKPVFDGIGAVFQWVYTNVIAPIVGYIKLAIQALGMVFDWLYRNAVKPAIDGVGRVFTWLQTNVIQPVWTAISTTIKTVWEKFIKPVIDTLVKVIKTDPKKAFEAARDAIGTAWAGIQELAKKPVRFVVNTVINGLIDTINQIPGVNIAKVALPKGFAGGGVIPGYNAHKRDTVLTPMRAGEGVLVPEVVRGLGAGFVHGLNAVGNAGGVDAVRRAFGGIGPGLALGGMVNPLPKGSYSVSQPFHGGHNGMDLAAPSGTKVYAADAGVALLAASVPMGGNEIYIQHPSGFGTRYSHMSGFAISQGATVRKNQTIGYVGSTGMSTGPHLHYMVHSPPGDGGAGRGYRNYVNPAPYMGVFGSEASGFLDILAGLTSWAADKFSSAFPDATMWVQAAGGLLKQGVASVVEWGKSKLGFDSIGTTLYDNGGLLQPGISLVENRTGRPEPILTGSQWKDLGRIATGATGTSGDGTAVIHIYDTDGVLIGTIDGRIEESTSGASARSLNDVFGTGR